MDLQTAAIRYAQAGFAVFPCAEGGKHPATPNGYKDATSDPETVASWWRQMPGANIGVVPGQSRGGHVVLDVDVKREAGGEESLADLELMNGELPDGAVEVATPSGGRHLWMALPWDVDPPGNQRPADGIDVRSGAGYVLLPPSRTGEGAYRVTRGHLKRAAYLPEEWKPALATSRGAARDRDRNDAAPVDLDHPADVKRAASHAATAPAAVEGAEGSARTYKVACELRSYGLSEAKTFELLAEHYNPRCEPPWDADPGNTGPDGLAGRVASAYRNARGQIGQHAAGDVGETVFGDIPATARQDTKPTTGDETDELGGAEGRQSRKTRFLTEAEVDEAEPPEWDIQDTLPRKSLIALYGEPGTHKSFLALDWANHLARGLPWAGRDVDAPRRVLYVAGEGTTGLQKRLRAWRQHHGTDMSANLVVSPDMPRVGDETWWEWVSDLREQGEFDLIVFDTLAYLTVGLEENSNTDMMRALSRLASLRDTLDASIMLVHHSGKDGREMRGATAILGACDTTFKMVKGNPGSSELEMQKQKDAEKWSGSLSLQGQEYTVGHDRKGRPITSLALTKGYQNDVPTKQEQALNQKEAEQVEQAKEQAAEELSEADEATKLATDVDRVLRYGNCGADTVCNVAQKIALERYGEAGRGRTDLLKEKLRKLSSRSRNNALTPYVGLREDGTKKRATHFALPETTKTS